MAEQQGEQKGEQKQPAAKKPLGGGDLSNFERLSAITPKKTPLAILIGTAMVPIVLWVINMLAPTEAVDELKKAEEEKTPSAQVGGPDIDEI
ncbi:MAG: hypothetical protein JRF63_03300 [Deltaproteobacteria bacterium]|nr:hypothetical protein [Deltaproteobacteria bacterium]